MSMFENYENIPTSYMPNNMCPPKKASCILKYPLAQYNAKGEFVGYTWGYGEEIILDFTITGDIINSGEDQELTFTITMEDYLKDKILSLTLFNFRGEAIWKGYQKGSSNVIFYIDGECSKNLLPGIYRSILRIEDGSKTILTNLEDYIFTIK